MNSPIKFEWEELTTGCLRSKVIGGWIVLTSVSHQGYNQSAVSSSQIFIADPNHEWQIIVEKPDYTMDFSKTECPTCGGYESDCCISK